jgi:hypothetical protein
LKSLAKLLYKDLIQFGDRVFLLYRTIKVTDKIEPNILKQYWHCDTVLKKENLYYFCNEIKQINYEEIRYDRASDTTPG